MDLRLVVLDYPKLLIDDPMPQRAFSDLLFARQRNYIRSSINYVSMNGQDAISTHFMLCDQSDLYNPKVVAGMRLSYSHRSRHHKLRLPIEDHIGTMPSLHQKRFAEFRADRPVLTQLGALFVDPAYSYMKTGLKAVEIIYFAGIHYLVRKGFDHYIGESNEKFKVSNIVRSAGTVKEDLPFQHPDVDAGHKLLLFERLNHGWLAKECEEFGHYFNDQVEFYPRVYPQVETLLSVEATNQHILKGFGLKTAA